MILTIAACVAVTNLGPVTPAAAAQRRNIANAEAVRVALIDSSLNVRIVQLVQVEARVGAGPTGAGTGQVVIMDDRGNRTVLAISGSGVGLGGGGAAGDVLALAPSWWFIDDTSGTPGELPSTKAGGARRPGMPGVEVATAARIQLTDGQRFIGQLGAPELDAARNDQTIRWMHPQLGGLTLPIDRVRRIELRSQGPNAGTATAASAINSELDRVWLVNGDRVEGYVESIFGGGAAAGAPDGAVSVTRDAQGSKDAGSTGPATIALSQVASMDLGNPPERPQGLMLWLGDASVIAAQRFDIDAANGRVTLNARVPGATGGPAQTGPASLDLSDLRAIAFDAGRITPLSQLQITGFSPQGGRRIAEAPKIRPVAGDGWPSPLGADDIELPGPMLTEWELPDRAVRVAGWISLDPSARVWGDCEVSVSVVGGGSSAAPRELARQRISAAHPIMPVNVVLPGLPGTTKLRVTVDPGERGPIQDRVSLRRMLILTAPESSKPTPR